MSRRNVSLTLRLSAGLAADLALVAAVDQQTQNDVVRLAIGDYIARRVADPDFRDELRQHISWAGRLLVADDPEVPGRP